jgi:hypothetical protein
MVMLAPKTADLLFGVTVSMVTVPLKEEPSARVPLMVNTVDALALPNPSKQDRSSSLAAPAPKKLPCIIVLNVVNI